MKKADLQEYENTIKELRNLLAAQKAEIANKTAENDELKRQLAVLRKSLYGSRSERTKTHSSNPGQLSLFNEAELEGTEEAVAETITTTEVKAHTRKKQPSKKLDLKGLETKTVVHDIPEAERKCPECNSTNLECIGQELLRYELHVVPAAIEVIKHVRNIYKCLDCSNDEHTSIIKATMEKPLIPHSPVTASSMTMTILNKYQFAMPFNRQEKLWQMMGIPVSKANMSNWILYAYRDYLKPLVGLMHQELLQESIIHADETSVQVMKEKGRKNTTKSYMWVYSTGAFARHQIRLFQYQPGRSGDFAKEYLAGFHGYLHTDAYGGYNKVKNATHCYCYAHARRRFLESIPAGLKNVSDTIAGRAIESINRLFEIERKATAMGPEERKELRKKESEEEILALFEMLKKSLPEVPQSSAIGKAIKYMLNNEQSFKNYLEDGRCSISNNIAENSIRPFTVGRKNWILSGSPRGAEASAAMYSMIETCLANNIDTRDYFMYIFQHMSQEDNLQDEETLKKYLPWNIPQQET